MSGRKVDLNGCEWTKRRLGWTEIHCGQKVDLVGRKPIKVGQKLTLNGRKPINVGRKLNLNGRKSLKVGQFSKKKIKKKASLHHLS